MLSVLAAWMGGEFEGEWMHVYVWLSRFAIHLKYHNIVNWLYSNINYFFLKELYYVVV